MNREIELISQTAKQLSETIRSLNNNIIDLYENMDRSSLTIDERSELILVYQALNELSEGVESLKVLGKPVREEGLLKKNSNGRYTLGEHELTSGRPIEVFDEEGNVFYQSRMEHSGDDYYIYSLGKGVPIENIRCRIR